MRPTQAPPPREVWCDEHYRPAGPDGKCALCAQGEDPARSERRVVLVVVAIALLGGIGPAAYYFFWARHEEDRNTVSSASRSTGPTTKGKKRHVAQKERWVDEVRPSTALPEEPARRRQVTGKRRRGKRTVRRSSSRARRRRVVSRRLPARSKRQVSIIMYMAHW